MNNEKLEKLKQEFLDTWTEEKVAKMSLDQYTNLDRENSFCYWLESKTYELGSIWGGSSYKFGIYKRNDTSKNIDVTFRKSDGEYAWFTKYGETKEEAFKTVKNHILQIITYVKENNLKGIDAIDLGLTYKWKIAFLYSNYKVLNIFKLEALRFIAKNLQIQFTKKTSVSKLHKEILSKKGDENFFEFNTRLWQQYDKGLIYVKETFAKWLLEKGPVSYIDYYGKTEESIITKLDEINDFFDEVDFFLVNTENVTAHIQTIEFILSKEEREKRIDFNEYDKKNFSGIPKAILGKENYLKFLKEKYKQSNDEIVISEDLFALYEDYLLEHRSGEIKEKTIEGYVEIACEEIPKRWKLQYQTVFKDSFEISYENLQKVDFLLDKGFSGYYSFQNFLDTLISKFKKEFMKTKANNQILYGPPGTGKTYATKELAINLIFGKRERERKDVLKLFKELTENEQVVFTTFHQSMSYEDFVEGIKPKTENNEVIYDVEDGVFKKLANKAKGINGEIVLDNQVDFRKVNYFKMSVGGKNRKDVHDWCIKNNYIALGYGGENDLSKLVNLDSKTFKETFQRKFPEEFERTSYSVTATTAFINWLKKGDVVFVSLGNHVIDAIGVVTGDYEYNEFNDIPYRHFRKVVWLATGLDADPSLFIDKNISQQTIYQFNNDDIKVDYLEETFSKKEVTTAYPLDYVLIIDEINRGNVSAIFGELITLLEPDKRLGEEEAITVKLPYSKTLFGVPSNLHIIGTMNTADRSVEALDTALRRRFEFKEMLPKPSLLEDKVFEEEGISFNLKEVLETINNRVEALIDRDHTIGHSYFINIESGDKVALANAFNNKVIPLLQEYFYGDYGKIGLVLGREFVKEPKNKKITFADFKYFDKDNFINRSYTLKNVTEDDVLIAVNTMLGKQKIEKEVREPMLLEQQFE